MALMHLPIARTKVHLLHLGQCLASVLATHEQTNVDVLHGIKLLQLVVDVLQVKGSQKGLQRCLLAAVQPPVISQHGVRKAVTSPFYMRTVSRLPHSGK